MKRWPNQKRAIEQVPEAIEGGAKRICVTSPTGTGKSVMQLDMIQWAMDRNWRTALYTNRKMLLRQLKKNFERHGVEVGVLAADYKENPDAPFQLCSIQTVSARKIVDEWHSAPEQLVLVDELHNQTGPEAQRIFGRHIECGAVLVGYTATPLDIGHMVDELIVAGTVSEGRECGALVPANTYAPDEPDLAHIRKYPIGEDIPEAANHEAIMRPGILSRVKDNFERLNPDRLPTILFGPDVAGSLWFAQHLTANGIRSAHIDGNQIWIDGETHEATDELRDELARESQSGYLPVVCNRYVLREGIDWPWVRVGILATVMGSLKSYLQSCGRLLRNCEGKDSCIIIDHGGNWWRHGSVNADREWSLGATSKGETQARIERLRSKQEPQPIHCPKCARIRLSGAKCPSCGFIYSGCSRMVVQVNGSLKEIRGDIFKPRKVKAEPDTQKKWEQIFWRCKKSKRPKTFTQARGLFYHEHRYWPPENLPLMPLDRNDWHRSIHSVPFNQLIPKERSNAN